MALDVLNDRAFVLDRAGLLVVSVDLATGDRTVLQDLVDRNGPPLKAPTSIWYEALRRGLLLVDPRDEAKDLGPGLLMLLEAGPESVPETERATVSR